MRETGRTRAVVGVTWPSNLDTRHLRTMGVGRVGGREREKGEVEKGRREGVCEKKKGKGR